MTKAEIFIEKYKELEGCAESKYNLTKGDSPVAYLERLGEYASIRKELSYCREVRNFIQHENKIREEFAVIPSDEMIELIDRVIMLVKNPPQCHEVAIKMDKVYYKEMGDYVFRSMEIMNHRLYTHIPLLNDGVVVGVFSKSSAFNYLLDNNGQISKKVKFNEIIDYVKLDNDKYIFASFHDSIGHVSSLIREAFEKAVRIEMVFLTEHGNSKEKLLGILTAFDVLSVD